MKWRWLVALGSATALQAPVALAAQRVEGSAVISGMVRDSAGLALAGVTVSVQRQPFATITDGQGGFRLSGLPAGNHTLLVRRIGYVFLEHPFTIGAGETKRLDIVLSPRPALLEEMVVGVPGTGLRGVVHDFALEPIVGADITLDATSRTFRTGDDGWFHATGLRPGRYMVQVRAQGFETRRFSLMIPEAEAREVSVAMLRGRTDPRDEIHWSDFAQRRRWAARSQSLFMVREELQRLSAARLGEIPEIMSFAGPNPCVRFDGLPAMVLLEDIFIEEVEAIEVLSPDALPWRAGGAVRRQTDPVARREFIRGGNRPGHCTSNVTIWSRG